MRWWKSIVAMVIALSATSVFAADENMVFIDMSRVVEEYYKTELTLGRLEEQKKQYEGELEKLSDKIEKINEEYKAAKEDALNTALSEEVRNKKRDEAEGKMIERDRLVREARQTAKARSEKFDAQQQRMWKGIVDEIQEVVQSYAKDEGYTAVIDSSAQSFNGIQVMLYTDVKLDISDKILDLLNKGKQ